VNYQLKAFLVFMVVYNVAFSLVNYYVVDKTWAMILFGGFAYIYGCQDKRIEAYLKG
jgi:steroid 5-alpha reductase family enzyme